VNLQESLIKITASLDYKSELDPADVILDEANNDMSILITKAFYIFIKNISLCNGTWLEYLFISL